MRAIDLYSMTPESETTDLGELRGFYYDHLPEIDDDLWGYEGENTQVVIKNLKDFYFDGERTWTLRTIWFNGTPVMITQNAGRGGDDHRDRFITNMDAYKGMISHIKTLIQYEDQSNSDFLDEDKDVTYLDSFYGKKLSDEFHRY